VTNAHTNGIAQPQLTLTDKIKMNERGYQCVLNDISMSTKYKYIENLTRRVYENRTIFFVLAM
jgi:hypothetical protein